MLTEDQLRIINYLNFKVKCLADQEDYGLEVDKEAIEKHLQTLESLKEPIIEKLKEAMPKIPEYSVKNKPKVTHKKDGTLSTYGEKWFALLRKHKLPVTYDGEIKEVTGYREPNPGSSTQVKDWLFSLGWEPCTFKFTRNKETGDEKETPQVRYSSASHPRKGELTDSVVRLKDKEPNIEYLENITTVNHRISIFEGFLSSLRPEFDKPTVVAQAGGFTNTLRFKHRVPVVNLPKVDRPWGNEIRSSIVSGEGKVFLGSDMVSLEDTTKRHYIQPLDPDYVAEMEEEGYDPHMKLLVIAGIISEEDYKFYASYKEGADEGRFKELKSKRNLAKVVNYSSLYGVGAAKLAREMGITQKEARILLEAFWDINWAVREVSSQQYIKTLKDGSMWVKNTVSGLYYSLRYEKDVWSTINQSTGVYCFDTWVAYCKALEVEIPMQYHDEILARCDEDKVEETKAKLQKAIELTNKKIKLNIPLAVDIQTGVNYAEVH